jgi:membrane associated rhomboid family serine protease
MNQLAPPDPPRATEAFRPVAVVVALLAVMWAVEVIDLLPSTDLDRWGVRPRSPRGLFGVVLAPFLHSGFGHLFANTIPFLVLGAVIAIGSVGRFVEVSVIVGLTSGLGTWLFAAPGTVHIGASGLVFGYLTYLVARGFFAGRILWILGGVVVLLFYGGILWGLLPRPGVSWTGHVFGAVGGVLAAWYVHGREPEDADLVRR